MMAEAYDLQRRARPSAIRPRRHDRAASRAAGRASSWRTSTRAMAREGTSRASSRAARPLAPCTKVAERSTGTSATSTTRAGSFIVSSFDLAARCACSAWAHPSGYVAIGVRAEPRVDGDEPILASVAGKAPRRQALLRGDCVESVHAIPIPPAKGLRRRGSRQCRQLRPARGRSVGTGSAAWWASPRRGACYKQIGLESAASARHPQGRQRIVATTSRQPASTRASRVSTDESPRPPSRGRSRRSRRPRRQRSRASGPSLRSCRRHG